MNPALGPASLRASTSSSTPSPTPAPTPTPAATPSPTPAPTPAPTTRLRDIPRPLLFAALGWLALALVIAATGVLQRFLPLIPLMFVTLLATTLFAWHRLASFRAWTTGLDLRVPILLHVSRIVFGALFLVELAAGRLPALFAERGGYGDLVAGALAIVAAIAAGRPRVRNHAPDARLQPASKAGRALVWVFSIVGLVDIALVFMTAQVLAFVHHDAQLIAAIGSLPYALLPTVVVPLVVLTHLLVIQRLRAAR